VRSFHVSNFDQCEIESAIEALVHLRHPRISQRIGFALERRELKVRRLHGAGLSRGGRLLSAPASWTTTTAKAEAVVGIAFALRFADGLGLMHEGLHARNVLFDARGGIQISDFNPMRRGSGEVFYARDGPRGRICPRLGVFLNQLGM
jgi:hypothetical protein